MRNLKVGDIVVRMAGETKIIDRIGSLDAIEKCKGKVWCERSHYVNPEDLEMATDKEVSEFLLRASIFTKGTEALLNIQEPEYI